MTLSWAIPTIASIQRTNFIIVVVSASILALFASAPMAVGCMLGGTVVIANLWILAALGSLLVSASSAGVSGAAAKLGALAIPLKLFIIVGLVYLIFTRARIDGMGFGVGVLTQLAAIIIETGRASLRGAS
jgi:ATP synthase I chain